ncbi:hypothetical protein ASPFODRAFT_329621 [Aspergillus luchuensis CBS 106.47]|uniref:Uncharacterized protein n=1 Tax=Aspergillus luchuensis (strain CBS 106.47) TaxID=1137211 RepID=A0A1M3T7D4_ASPLC|nr:hypothetical protein ASPFODRAFT_329621 [Aspergillus luchuensis CBS 106.47]
MKSRAFVSSCSFFALPWSLIIFSRTTSYLARLSFPLQGQIVAPNRSVCTSLRHAIFLRARHWTATRTNPRTWLKLEST